MPTGLGRSSSGGGPLGDRGPRELTLRARGSGSAQGRNGPGAFGRRGRPLSGHPARHPRQRWQAAARTAPHLPGSGHCSGHPWGCSSGHREARRAPCGARVGTTGAFPAPSPTVPAGAGRHPQVLCLASAWHVTRPAAGIPGGNRRADITVVLPWPTHGRPPDRYRATNASAPSGSRVSTERQPGQHRAAAGSALGGSRVSAWRRRRARRPRSRARPPPRWSRPAPRRATPSR